MNSLERQIEAQQKHIDNLYETIKGWEQVAKDKDKIIKKYQEQVENYVDLANVSKFVVCPHCNSKMITTQTHYPSKKKDYQCDDCKQYFC